MGRNAVFTLPSQEPSPLGNTDSADPVVGGCVVSGWVGVGCVGVGCVGVGCVGAGWVGAGWVGAGWVGADWVAGGVVFTGSKDTNFRLIQPFSIRPHSSPEIVTRSTTVTDSPFFSLPVMAAVVFGSFRIFNLEPALFNFTTPTHVPRTPSGSVGLVVGVGVGWVGAGCVAGGVVGLVVGAGCVVGGVVGFVVGAGCVVGGVVGLVVGATTGWVAGGVVGCWFWITS